MEWCKAESFCPVRPLLYGNAVCYFPAHIMVKRASSLLALGLGLLCSKGLACNACTLEIHVRLNFDAACHKYANNRICTV